ncbi:hypothetical protein ACFVRU_56145 [Streptomyces sp. NPDC057927]
MTNVVFSNLNLLISKEVVSGHENVVNEVPYLTDGVLINNITVNIETMDGRIVTVKVEDWDASVEQVIIN